MKVHAHWNLKPFKKSYICVTSENLILSDWKVISLSCNEQVSMVEDFVWLWDGEKNRLLWKCTLLYFLHGRCRSSHRRCSIEKGVLKNFAKFTGKYLRQSLFFNKVADLKPAILLKKKLRHRCFHVKFAKFLRTPFFRTPPVAASEGISFWKVGIRMYLKNYFYEILETFIK